MNIPRLDKELIVKTTLIRMLAVLAVAVAAFPALASAHSSSVIFDKLVRPDYVVNFATICRNLGGHFSTYTYYPNPTYWVGVRCTK
jgi:predicted MFS family arabinose efflux permease